MRKTRRNSVFVASGFFHIFCRVIPPLHRQVGEEFDFALVPWVKVWALKIGFALG